MTVKTMQTNDVKELLEKVAGFDQAGGNERMKKIVHRVMRAATPTSAFLMWKTTPNYRT